MKGLLVVIEDIFVPKNIKDLKIPIMLIEFTYSNINASNISIQDQHSRTIKKRRRIVLSRKLLMFAQ